MLFTWPRGADSVRSIRRTGRLQDGFRHLQLDGAVVIGVCKVAAAFRGISYGRLSSSPMHTEPFWEERADLISNFHSRQRTPLTIFLSPFSVMAWLIILRISGSRSLTVPRATLSQYHSAH